MLDGVGVSVAPAGSPPFEGAAVPGVEEGVGGVGGQLGQAVGEGVGFGGGEGAAEAPAEGSAQHGAAGPQPDPGSDAGRRGAAAEAGQDDALAGGGEGRQGG